MDTAESSPLATLGEHELVTEGQEIWPLYLILDQSASMSGELELLGEAVERLVAELRTDPYLDNTMRLSVISFGTTAQVTIPLSRLSDITSVPTLTALGGTSFGAAWHAYERAFQTDREAIRAKNAAMHRPCVFVLTDGRPYPDDQGEFRGEFLSRLGKDANKAWPYVIAYGFRGATAPVVRDIAYPDFGEKRGFWFLSAESDPETAIQTFVALVFTMANMLVSAHPGHDPQPEQILASAGLLAGAIEYGVAGNDRPRTT